MTMHAKHGSSEVSRWPNISSVRVLIADDHPVVRVGVRNMLASEPIIDVIAEAGDGDEALDLTKRLSPDVLLLDISMPRLSGFDVLRRIMDDSPTVKIILLTAGITPQQIIEALQTGARGVILKNTITDRMSEAVMSVAAGDYWIGGKRVVNLVAALHDLEQKAAKPERKTYGLTPREMEVVGCIVEGCSNRDIAQQFHLSEETVKRHLSNIFDKTGVSTRLELAMFAIAHELVSPTPPA
ncbi:MAG: response regulator [Acidobacteriaceae bacterium]